MSKLTDVELQIQKLLEKEDYEGAEGMISRYEQEISPVHRAIFKACIAMAVGKKQQTWEEITTGLKLDGTNYELYLMLGEYYADSNSRQAYLCYENALFYCTKEEDRKPLKKLLEEYKERGVFVPKVAIVILSYNLLDMTRECVESIRQTTAEDMREIIVVDNASEDGSVEWLKQQPDIRLLCNQENRGFPRGCNQGIELADKNADIFLLNNDTLLTQNALFWLRMGLYEDDSVGSTGSVSNYVSNLQAVIENGKTRQEYLEFAKSINVPEEHPYQNKVHLVGFALLLKRTVLDITGLLDERFSPGNYEDNDICLRISLAGYRNVMCKNSFIIHWGSKSFGKAPKQYRNFILTNQQKFFDKWKEIGLTPNRYLSIRTDMINALEGLKANDKTLAVVGTADGALLSYLQGKYPKAQIFGMEQQGFLAKLADKIADTAWTNLDEWCSDELLETFDVLIINNVLENIKQPEKVLGELSRMLKKDGKMIISFANRNYFSVIHHPSISAGFLTRSQMEKMLLKEKLSIDRWGYTYTDMEEEKVSEEFDRIRKQYSDVSKEELKISNWVVTARQQRSDLRFDNRMCVCIPTYEHPEAVEDVLSHSADLYHRYGLDVYYYDSSRDDRTKQIIERYQKEGYDNLYYIHTNSDESKVMKIFDMESIEQSYTYMWYLRDRCWCEENTLQLMYRGVCEEHDLIFLDVGHPKVDEEYRICNNANEFYHSCGDYATSMDTTIYHVSSMLGFDKEKFVKKYQDSMKSFPQFMLIFDRLSQKKQPDICLLAGEDVVIWHSNRCGSMWSDQRIQVWGEHWIKVNEALPDCYDDRDDVIKRTASFPWLLGSKAPLVELHQKGILTPEYYQEIKDWWERVSPIPLETLKQIAYGEYLPEDVEEKQRLYVKRFGRIFSDINEGKILPEKVKLEEVKEVVLQAAQYSGIGEKKWETLKDMLGAIEKLGEKEVQTKENIQLILYIYMGALRLVQK